jgi:uncharacterized protein
MDGMQDAHLVTDAAALRTLYGEPSDGAIAKEVNHVHPHYRAMIEASPFMVMATSGPDGLDVSPRGDPPGFVVVEDETTLLIPDRRGNNRTDSLCNLIADPRIALLFLIPGVGRTLRINGRAAISIDRDLCASFTMEGKVPRSVIVVTAESVYTQCPKALVRSRLWDVSLHVDESSLPSSGTIMKALQKGFDGETYDRDYPQRLKETIY